MRRSWRGGWAAAAVLAFSLGVALREARGGPSAETQRWMADKRGVLCCVETAEPVVALTFDDGPDPKTTPAVLAALRAANARATFFLQGRFAEAYPDLARQIVLQGSEIGNHSYNHLAGGKLKRGELSRDVERTERAIERASRVRPRIYRFPQFRQPAWAVDEINRLGYVVVGASVDPQDWRAPPANVLVRRVVDAVRPGNIIVLHDGGYRPRTIKALPDILRQLTADGYHFVTVSELITKGKPSWVR